MNLPPYGDKYRKLDSHFMSLKVIPQTIPNMTVRITPGFFWYDHKNIVDFPGATTRRIEQPERGTKFVIVGLTKQGNIELIDGDPSVDPKLPELPTELMPLAAVVVRANTSVLTEDNIFDIRQVFQSPNFVTSHKNIPGREEQGAHPIEAIEGLKEVLDNKVEINALNSRLNKKADVDGTTSSKFIINKDETDIPVERCSLVIGRGTEPEVAITWDENKNRWIIDEDIQISDPNKGLLLTSENGNIYRVVASNDGIIKLKDIVSGSITQVQDQYVRINGDDEVPGYLLDKLAEEFFEYDAENNVVKIKEDAIAMAVEANENVQNVGKVSLDENDEKGYLAEKLDETLEVEDGKLKVSSQLKDVIDNKVDKDAFNNELSKKASQLYVDGLLADKADQETVNNKFNTIDAQINDINEELIKKADSTDVQSLSNKVAEKADQYEVDALNSDLASKAAQVDVDALQTSVSQLEEKTDELETDKADKTYVDGELALKANKEDVDASVSELTDKVNKLETDKADKSYVDDELALKANQSAVDTLNSELTEKAKQEDLDALSGRVDGLEATLDNKADSSVLVDYVKNEDLNSHLNPLNDALNDKASKEGAEDIIITDFNKGVILTSENGSQFRIVVDNEGKLSTMMVKDGTQTEE